MSHDHEVPHTPEDVVDYLKKEYGMSKEDAASLVERRKAILTYGIELRSFTYFIGDEMIRAEKKQLPDDAKYVPSE